MGDDRATGYTGQFHCSSVPKSGIIWSQASASPLVLGLVRERPQWQNLLTGNKIQAHKSREPTPKCVPRTEHDNRIQAHKSMESVFQKQDTTIRIQAHKSMERTPVTQHCLLALLGPGSEATAQNIFGALSSTVFILGSSPRGMV